MEENLDEFDYMIINVEYLLNGSINDRSLFVNIGDCRGNNDTLNQMIQTAFDNAQIQRITIKTVIDNVGTSCLQGGMTTVIIFKSDESYAPIVGLKYNEMVISIIYGSIYEGKFTGFSKQHI